MIVRRFHLNPGTGGNGFHKGGDGVVRELVFRRPQVLSVLSERRSYRPYGIQGNIEVPLNLLMFSSSSGFVTVLMYLLYIGLIGLCSSLTFSPAPLH